MTEEAVSRASLRSDTSTSRDKPIADNAQRSSCEYSVRSRRCGGDVIVRTRKTESQSGWYELSSADYEEESEQELGMGWASLAPVNFAFRRCDRP